MKLGTYMHWLPCPQPQLPKHPLRTNTRTDAMDPFSSFPSELIYMVVNYLDRPRDLCALIRSNCRMRDVLTPLLHTLAREDKDGMNALCWAALKGDRFLILLLLESGFDINHEGRQSESALARAVRHQRVPIVKLLLERGADANTRLFPYRVLLHAVLLDDEVMTRDLLMHGANLIPRYRNAYTALHQAAANGNIPILRLLLDHGAGVDDIGGGITALHAAIKDIHKHKIQSGYVDTTPATVEEILARRVEAVKFLLEKGANINARDLEGRAAIHYAVIERQETMARILIENMADIEATDQIGRTALHYAVIHKNEPIIKLLLEVGGSNIGCLDVGGRTPVDWAVEPVPKMFGYVHYAESAWLVRLLLKGRISIYLSTWPDGGRVLDWARLAECKDVMTMFAVKLA